MSKKNIKRYNIDKISQEGANFNIIYGERSGGKSYQVKHKKAINSFLFGREEYFDDYKNPGNIIKKCIEKGSRFIYLRRWKEEINSFTITQYFADVDIHNLTDGRYDTVDYYRKKIYLARISEDGKIVKGEHIGYATALSVEQNFASLSFLDVTDIIFEEFMSRSGYLANEPTKLLNFYSTIDRKRGTTKVWLLGNTITKVCPYINEWGLTTIVRNQKQGTIDFVWVTTNNFDDDNIEIKVKIAIEYCEDTGSTSFIFGKHANMLNNGSWQTDPQPKLNKSLKEYKTKFVCGFQYKSFKFLGRLLYDTTDKNMIWFIQPYNKDFKKKLIVFSDIIKSSPYFQRDIYNITFKDKKPSLYKLFLTFRESNIFYSDDGCGTDFKQAIDFVIRK